MESHDPHHSRDAWRVDSILLSYHDPLVESLLSHPVRPAFFGIRMSSYFSFWGTHFWSVSLIQLWTLMTRIAHSMRDDLISFNFSTYHTFDSILGHISSSIEFCRSSLICMTIPSYEIHTRLMIWLHFTLILRWSLSWDIRSGLYFLILSWFLDGVISDTDSHIIISGEYMSDLLYIPAELFSSHQDRLDDLVAILGHISLFQPWRWLFSHRAVTVFITQSRDVYSHYWS